MSRAQHIVVVDDEAAAREMIGDYLRMHGFSVSLCDGGKSLRAEIAKQGPDLIVLDLNMPEEDGLSIIRDLKQRSSVPVIMLTATASPIDRVVGLELGPTTTSPSPASCGNCWRASARCCAVPPRAGDGGRSGARGGCGGTGEEVGPFRHQVARSRQSGPARRRGNEHPLQPSEFSLLKSSPPIPSGCWRASACSSSPLAGRRGVRRAVDIRIMRIRRKIEPDPAHPSVIRTVRGGGYLFSPIGEKP